MLIVGSMICTTSFMTRRSSLWRARSDPYTHFPRAKRVAYAIVDVVSRCWIGYLLSTGQTTTQAQLLFAQALEDQGLRQTAQASGQDPDASPILVAWSDNGSEMTAIDTRQLMAIAQHHGRPGTPTDQAHVDSFFSHHHQRDAHIDNDLSITSRKPSSARDDGLRRSLNHLILNQTNNEVFERCEVLRHKCMGMGRNRPPGVSFLRADDLSPDI